MSYTPVLLKVSLLSQKISAIINFFPFPPQSLPVFLYQDGPKAVRAAVVPRLIGSWQAEGRKKTAERVLQCFSHLGCEFGSFLNPIVNFSRNL